jgi:hypothetical protein
MTDTAKKIVFHNKKVASFDHVGPAHWVISQEGQIRRGKTINETAKAITGGIDVVITGDKITADQQRAIDVLTAELRSRYEGAEISGLPAPKPVKPKTEDSANADVAQEQTGLAKE